MTKCMITIMLILATGLIPTLIHGEQGTKIKKENPITISILFDNDRGENPKVKTDWGFACLVKGMEKTILFDTGNKGEMLLENFKIMKEDPKRVETVIISHDHWDHVGGLEKILELRPGIPVYYPVSAEKELSPMKKNMEPFPAKENQHMTVCPHVHLTGEIKGPVNEHSMIIDSPKGLVIITGCAHPGIALIVEKAKKQLKKEVYLVLGGFHLLRTPAEKVTKVIGRLKELGVKKIAPSHCTGDHAIEAFKKAFAENYIKTGAGSVITI